MNVIYMRIKRYYCPHCQEEEKLFSFKPIMFNTWRCGHCGEPFRLTFKAIADNWVQTLAFWGLIPSFLLSLSFALSVDAFWKLLVALVTVVPLFTFGFAIVFFVLAMPVGLIAAAIIQNRPPPEGDDHPSVEWELD
jgi:hypothetical protein